MNTYEKYVNIIREVTKLNVPVVFNAPDANYGGGAYAGFCGYADVIAPELCYDSPISAMFEFEDFLEQEHLKYFHIGLPDKICKGEADSSENLIIKELLHSVGIGYSVEAVEIFVILHEFGHAHYLFYKCRGNIIEYLKARRERKKILYELRLSGFDKIDTQRRYRQIPSEKYADDFAKKYIRQVLACLTSNQSS